MTANDPIVQRLMSHHPRVITLGLERIERLLERLGSPHKKLPPLVHVAGTNGKGSTCAMIEAIQRAHGRRTGLYTSPHLVAIGERIQVDRRPLPDERVVALVEMLDCGAMPVMVNDVCQPRYCVIVAGFQNMEPRPAPPAAAPANEDP